MSKVSSQISISLDGYVAGPNQSLDNPLGEGGERLLENVGDPKLEPVEVVASPAATHVRYRVGR